MRKKILAIMFALTMCIGLVACGTVADENPAGNREENGAVNSKNTAAEEERLAEEEEETTPNGYTNDEGADNSGANAVETITFGHYEQDNDTTNGAEPIEWLVLAKEEDKMLVISRYALDCQIYNSSYEVTWENCTLRSWLNDSFYNVAFSSEEQGRIVTVLNSNPDASEYQGGWEGKGGNATNDNVFCLNYEEALAYFASDEARRCTATAYATAQGALSKEYENSVSCNWWLRSQGVYQTEAMAIARNGSLFCYYMDYDIVAVRPAMWISVN